MIAIALASAPAMADEAPTRPEKHESDALPPPSAKVPAVVWGLGMTAGVYALNTGTSFVFRDATGISSLRIPVAGPWLAFGRNSTCPSDGCGVAHYFNYVYYAVSGLAQAGGLAIALEGLLLPTAPPGSQPATPSIKQTEPAEDRPIEDAPPSVTPSPADGKPLFYMPLPATIGHDGVGVTWGGIFF